MTSNERELRRASLDPEYVKLRDALQVELGLRSNTSIDEILERVREVASNHSDLVRRRTEVEDENRRLRQQAGRPQPYLDPAALRTALHLPPEASGVDIVRRAMDVTQYQINEIARKKREAEQPKASAQPAAQPAHLEKIVSHNAALHAVSPSRPIATYSPSQVVAIDVDRTAYVVQVVNGVVQDERGEPLAEKRLILQFQKGRQGDRAFTSGVHDDDLLAILEDRLVIPGDGSGMSDAQFCAVYDARAAVRRARDFLARWGAADIAKGVGVGKGVQLEAPASPDAPVAAPTLELHSALDNQLRTRVRNALTAVPAEMYPIAAVHMHAGELSSLVIWVVSPRFEGVPEDERIDRVWRVLSRALAERDLTCISGIRTFHTTEACDRALRENEASAETGAP